MRRLCLKSKPSNKNSDISQIPFLYQTRRRRRRRKKNGSRDEARWRISVRLLPFDRGVGAALRRPVVSTWNLLPQIAGGPQRLVQRWVRRLHGGREAWILRGGHLAGAFIPVAPLSPQPLRRCRRSCLVPHHLLDLRSLCSRFHGISSSYLNFIYLLLFLVGFWFRIS